MTFLDFFMLTMIMLVNIYMYLLLGAGYLSADRTWSLTGWVHANDREERVALQLLAWPLYFVVASYLHGPRLLLRGVIWLLRHLIRSSRFNWRTGGTDER